MTLWSRIQSWLRAVLHRERSERDMDAELRFHLDAYAEDLVRSGIPREEALRRARLEFGGLERAKEECRDATGSDFLDSLLQDLRYGLRMLRKSPGFTTVAVLTLALGVGANTAIFTIFDAVLLESLPVRAPAQLVFSTDSVSEGAYSGGPPSDRWEMFSNETADYLRKQSLSFESLAAVRAGNDTVTVRLANVPVATGPAERSQVHLVSGNYFHTMGVDSVLGRMLGPEDDQPSATPVVVASFSYWKQKLHGNPGALGQTVYLNGSAFTIVGIAPPEFFGERIRHAPDFWVPLVFQPQIQLRPANAQRTDEYWLTLIGRLSHGTSRAQAQTASNAALRQFLTNQAGSQLTQSRKREIDGSFIEWVDGSGGISYLRYVYSQPLHILLAVVGMVLLIACANVGNLLLSRAAARQTEISVRLALGGSRWRLVRQLLTESLLLAVLGAACGLLFAHWAVRVLFTRFAQNSPIEPHLNVPVLIFTILITMVAGILFGLAPAFSAGHANIALALKAGTRSATGDRRRVGTAQLLIVAQNAICLVLLLAASLFARSLLNLEKQPLGFEQSHVLLIGVNPRLANYSPESVAPLYRKLYDRLSALPGVRSTTVARYSPMSGSASTNDITIQGRASTGETLFAETLLIGPSYAETMGMTLLQGREIGFQDTAATPKVALVNEAFVRAFFPKENPLGHHFDIHQPKDTGEYEIVGVLRDAQFHSAKEKAGPMVLPALLQDTSLDTLSCEFSLRTAGDPESMIATARQAVAQVDPTLPITGTSTLTGQIASTFNVARTAAQLVSFFGALALLLACVGLYGVVAQSVVRRTNEIGVRMALGASAGDILWMVLRGTLTLIAIGLAIGMPLCFVAMRLIKSQLYGVGAAEASSFVVPVLMLLTVALVAGILPARRAMRVDPMVALRYE
ncbi:MAG TPA: ABC transporter permease [Candidatus Sulfotelmatobacter sp.]|nr:ABC transporter permease [Candidatus Sulfotelmatobacter sp.]